MIIKLKNSVSKKEINKLKIDHKAFHIKSENNHLLIIPCHRVVRSDGSLGGFSGLGGVKLKKKLLELEL